MKTTFEIVKEKIENNTVAQLKENIANGFDHNLELDEIAETYMMFLSACSSTFVSDIAKKAQNKVRLSEKQAWCCAYELKKIIHMYDAFVENYK